MNFLLSLINIRSSDYKVAVCNTVMQLSLRRTSLWPAPSDRLREMSVLKEGINLGF